MHSDDALAQADTAEAGSGAFSERADQAASTGVKGGSKAAEETSGNASEEGEGEQTKAEGSAQGARGAILRQKRDQRAD